MNKCYSKVVNYSATKGMFSTLHFKEIFAALEKLHNNSFKMFSLLVSMDKEFAQTHGNQLLPITPICCYLSSPTFLTPVHLFYTEVLLSSRPRVYQPHGNPYTKAKPKRHETNGDTYVASWVFPPIHYTPTQ